MIALGCYAFMLGLTITAKQHFDNKRLWPLKWIAFIVNLLALGLAFMVTIEDFMLFSLFGNVYILIAMWFILFDKSD